MSEPSLVSLTDKGLLLRGAAAIGGRGTDGQLSNLQVPPRDRSPEFTAADIAYCVQAAVCITVKQPDSFLQSGRRNHGAGFWIEWGAGEFFILTNEHLVKGGKGKLPDMQVLSHKGDKEFEIIKVNKIGSVPDFDIALLQPTNSSFRPPVCLSSTTSEALVQGAPVVVVGFPHGRYRFNAVRGSISSSTECNDEGIIAVDANVNPGNSGGPVFIIQKGGFAVAGMLTIKHGDMGIAIASPMLRWAVNEILKGRQSAS